MARSKWIPAFAQQQLQNNQAAQEHAVPAHHDQVVVPPDAKKFGLENFGNTWPSTSVLLSATSSSRLPIPPSRPPRPRPSTRTPSPNTGRSHHPSSPVRRKPERKASTSGQPFTTLANVPAPAPVPPIPSNPPTLFSALRSLFAYISTNPGEKGTVAPRAFIDKLKFLNESFRTSMHQDAHEFLNYLLNRIVEEIEEERRQASANQNGAVGTDDLSSSIGTLPPPPSTIQSASSNSGTAPQDATLVHKLFEGVLTSETRCLSCETVSARDESFLDLSIDIEQNSSVTACLRQFSASEMLGGGNKFSCDSCGGLQEAEKRMKIKKLPNVLALHLKRFKYQEDVQKYIKLTYRVAFPFELRLFNTVDDLGDDADRLYNLFAIVVHIGTGPHHGHYISIIKTLNTWLVFDDENVYPILESDIPKYFGESNSGSAYVLYYQAADIDLVSLGLQSPTLPIPTPEEEPIPIAIPSTTLDPALPAPPLPPGLAPAPAVVAEDAASDTSADIPLFSSPDSASPAPPPPVTPIKHLPPLQISVAESSASSHTSSSMASGGAGVVGSTPLTPTGKSVGNRLLGLRRAASISMKAGGGLLGARPGAGDSGVDGSSPSGEQRRSGSEKLPRANASTPTLQVVPPHGDVGLEPLPPLPPAVQPSKSLPLEVNGREKEKEKAKKEKSSNWFVKRKSFRLGDKDKEREKEKTRSRGEDNTADGMAPSPIVSNRSTNEEHQSSSSSSAASHWFKTAGHYHAKEKHKQRQLSEAGGYAFTSELSGASGPPATATVPVPLPKSSTAGLGSHRHHERYQVNGYNEVSTPHSSSSTSTSFGSVPPLPPGAAPSSAPSTSGQPFLDFPPQRVSSINPALSDSEQPKQQQQQQQQQYRSSSDHHRSSSTNTSRKARGPPPPAMIHRPATAAAVPLTLNRASSHTERERHLPPLPPTPQYVPPLGHERHQSVANGNAWTAEPESMYPPPTGMKGKTRSTDGNHAPNDASDPLLLRPGGSSATGHTYHTPSGPPPTSTMKRTTRKLSLPAPMLGFGRRDKDKDKEREREREKEKAPSAFSIRF